MPAMNNQAFKGDILESMVIENRKFNTPILGQDLAGVMSSRKSTKAAKLSEPRLQIGNNVWSFSDKIPHVVQAN